MADNTQVVAGSGDTIRDKDRSGVKTQIVGLDLGVGTGTENLMTGENHLGEIAGNLAQVLVTVTRPANTTAYVALQSVNTSTSAPTIITFTSLLRKSGGTGYITKAKLQTDQSGCVARLKLHLFNVSNPTLSNDGAAYTQKWADRAAYLGSITFPALSIEGVGSDMASSLVDNLRTAVIGSGNANIYGLLETLDAFTPNSAQNFHLELTCDNN